MKHALNIFVMGKIIAIFTEFKKEIIELKKHYEIYFFILRFNSRYGKTSKAINYEKN